MLSKSKYIIRKNDYHMACERRTREQDFTWNHSVEGGHTGNNRILGTSCPHVKIDYQLKTYGEEIKLPGYGDQS